MVSRRSSSRLHQVSPEGDTNNVALEVLPTTPMKRKQSSITTPTTVESKFTHDELDSTTNINLSKAKDDDDDDVDDVEVYLFNGVNYTTYQDMVHAKRQRNQQILEQSGLLASISSKRRSNTSTTTTNKVVGSKRGIQANSRGQKNTTVSSSSSFRNNNAQRLQSSRLQGIESDGLYIDEERAGRVTVAGTIDDPTSSVSNSVNVTTSSMNSKTNVELVYRDRINDGVPLSISEAMEYAGTKWMTDTSISDATAFIQQVLVSTPPSKIKTTTTIPAQLDPTSNIGKYRYDPSQVNELECNDVERSVAKICPDRIFSMAVHPSTNHLIVSAGDKLEIGRASCRERVLNLV